MIVYAALARSSPTVLKAEHGDGGKTMAENGKQEAWQRAETWQSAAIAAAIGTPVVAAFLLPWISDAADDQAMLYRVQIVGAGVAVGLAFVTFCTVVWRGLISTEQARLQRVQIDKLTEQIAATEESNLADLLQRGAELLAEAGKPAHVAAGIAILRSVSAGKTGLFAVEAMNLLADYCQDEFKRNRRSVLFESALDALKSGNRAGRCSDRRVGFRIRRDEAIGRLISGVRGATYDGGEAAPWDSVDLMNADAKVYQFQNAKISFFKAVDIDRRFTKCTFIRCTVKSIDDQFIYDNGFRACDFSGTLVESPSEAFAYTTLDEGNWFEPATPPIATTGGVADHSKPFPWDQHLLVGKPATESTVT